MKKEGWVYFIKCKSYSKVGVCTGDVRTRLKTYKTHNPISIKLLELVYVKDCLHLEKFLHSQFFVSKTDSDWVRLNKNQEDSVVKNMKDYQRQASCIPDYKKQLVGVAHKYE